MIELNFKFCINRNCSKVDVTDITGIQPCTPDGWGGTNILPDAINAEIILEVLDCEDVLLETIILKDSTINLYTSLSNSIELLSIDWGKNDGLYKFKIKVIEYDLIVPTTIVSETEKTFLITFFCNIRKCLDKAWINTLNPKLNTKERADLIIETSEMEALYKGLSCAASVYDIETMNSILKDMQVFCDLINMNDNCNC